MRVALTALAVAGMLTARVATAQAQAIHPIGEYQNAITEVAGISNSGVVAGSRTINPTDGAVGEPWRWKASDAWGSSGSFTLLPTFGGYQGEVVGLNQSGTCVGWASNGGLVTKPAYWPSTGGVSNLSAGRFSYTLRALNDASSPIIVGHTSDGKPAYNKGGKWSNLPTLGSSGQATDVNNRGEIVGRCYSAQGWRVVMWKPNSRGTYVLHELGHVQKTEAAVLITDSGLVAFNDRIVNLSSGAVTSISLPNAMIRAITDDGKAVGSYWSPVPAGMVESGFYHDGATQVDVNTLVPDSGWSIRSATGLNDKGQIVGMGVLGGQRRAYILTLATP